MQWVNKIIYFLSITNKESTVVNKKKKILHQYFKSFNLSRLNN